MQYITRAYLVIGGHNVASYVKQPGSDNVHYAKMSARFDSTYFQSGADLTIEFKMKLNTGVWVAGSCTKPVKNRTVLFNRSDFQELQGGYGASVVYDKFSGSTFDRRLHGAAWYHALIEEELDNCTVLYLHTHGNSGLHHTESSDPVFGTHYSNLRNFANWTGDPPFNSTGNPPVTFMQLEACNTGATNAFTTIFNPGTNWWSEIKNQALLSYKWTMYISESETRAQYVWDKLMQGKTVSEARDFMVQQGHENEDIRVNDGFYRPIQLATDAPVWGDWSTRVRNVYTGSNSVPTTIWYKLNEVYVQ